MYNLNTEHLKLIDVFPEKARRLSESLHKKADQIEYVKKGIPIDPAEIKIEEGERAAIRLITTPHLDRDGEILLPCGAILDDFRQSPSVLYGHDYKGLPIGKDIWIKPMRKGILAKTIYALHAFAEDVYQCVKGGFLNSNSVGFIPVDVIEPMNKKMFEKVQDFLENNYGISRLESANAKRIYSKWILLEHSDVPVAANPAALNIAVSKGTLPIKSLRLKADLGITGKSPWQLIDRMVKAELRHRIPSFGKYAAPSAGISEIELDERLENYLNSVDWPDLIQAVLKSPEVKAAVRDNIQLKIDRLRGRVY